MSQNFNTQLLFSIGHSREPHKIMVRSISTIGMNHTSHHLFAQGISMTNSEQLKFALLNISITL